MGLHQWHSASRETHAQNFAFKNHHLEAIRELRTFEHYLPVLLGGTTPINNLVFFTAKAQCQFLWLSVYQVDKVVWFGHIFIFFKDFIYFFMRDTEREAETQAEGEAGSIREARCGTRFQDSGITPWAKGRHQTAEPPRDPLACQFIKTILLALICATLH